MQNIETNTPRMPAAALQLFVGRPLAYPLNESARKEHLPDAMAIVCDTGATAAHRELCVIRRGELSELVRVEIPAPQPVSGAGGNARITLTYITLDKSGKRRQSTVSPDAAYLVRGYFDDSGKFWGTPARAPAGRSAS